MPLGLAIYHCGGVFVPRIEYDAKAGRMARVDRTADETAFTKTDITMSQPAFAFDFGTIEIGWLNFQAGIAPSFALTPYGHPMPARPDAGHKAGFRLRVWDGREAATRELTSCAGVTVNAIEALWDQFSAAPEAAAGQLPVFRFANVVVSGRNYAPVFTLLQWIPREAGPFSRRTVAVPGAAPIPYVAPVPTAALPRSGSRLAGAYGHSAHPCCSGGMAHRGLIVASPPPPLSIEVITMANIIIPTAPEDAAIEALRDRERQLETDIQMLTVRRDEVRELIALLTSRKPRAPRKPAPPKPAAAADTSTLAVDREPQVNGAVVMPFSFNAPAPEAA